MLDSSFPDVSGKGRGYQIQAYAEGTPDWPELRKVSVWQTVGALEQVPAIMNPEVQILEKSKFISSHFSVAAPVVLFFSSVKYDDMMIGIPGPGSRTVTDEEPALFGIRGSQRSL